MKLYSTKDASKYLNLSLPAVKYHIRQKHLAGQLISKTLVFTQDELDQFKSTKRSQGRPRKEIVQ